MYYVLRIKDIPNPQGVHRWRRRQLYDQIQCMVRGSEGGHTSPPPLPQTEAISSQRSR
jgi:hypothetical protein